MFVSYDKLNLVSKWILLSFLVIKCEGQINSADKYTNWSKVILAANDISMNLCHVSHID